MTTYTAYIAVDMGLSAQIKSILTPHIHSPEDVHNDNFSRNVAFDGVNFGAWIGCTSSIAKDGELCEPKAHMKLYTWGEDRKDRILSVSEGRSDFFGTWTMAYGEDEFVVNVEEVTQVYDTDTLDWSIIMPTVNAINNLIAESDDINEVRMLSNKLNTLMTEGISENWIAAHTQYCGKE